MTNKHNRIYRMISSFNDEESSDGLKNLTDIELEKINHLIDNEIIIDLKYNGKVCHWREGDLSYNILFLTESQIEFVKLIDKKLHEGLSGYTLIDDITEDVLYDRFDTSVFGFFQFEMRFDFFKYREENLIKDDILDKILKHGKESLSENDKLLLEDKKMISPIDEI
jgi:hypothetical protein